MASNVQLGNAARTAAVDAIALLLNTGGAGKIELYNGSQPAGPGTAVGAQTKMAELTFSADAFDDGANGVAVAFDIEDGVGLASGTASWARFKNGAGTAILDCSVGTSNADLILATTTISVGLVIPMSSLTFTMPA